MFHNFRIQYFSCSCSIFSLLHSKVQIILATSLGKVKHIKFSIICTSPTRYVVSSSMQFSFGELKVGLQKLIKTWLSPIVSGDWIEAALYYMYTHKNIYEWQCISFNILSYVHLKWSKIPQGGFVRLKFPLVQYYNIRQVLDCVSLYFHSILIDAWAGSDFGVC